MSNAKQAIKLVHNPDFDTWEVPTPSLVKRCGYEAGFFVVGAAGVVLGFASGGAALPAVLAIVASSGPLVKCVT